MSENAARNSSHSEPKRLTAGVLALLVHAVFIAILVFGLSWKDHPPEGMMVDIWTELPQPVQAPPKQPEPQPEPPKTEPPKPEPPKPEPPKPEPPKPEPVKTEPSKPVPQKPAVTPPVKKPDIAMKQKPDLEEQKKKEQEKIKEQERLKELEKQKALEKQKELERQKELAKQKELQQQKEKELAAQRQREQEAKARQAAEAQRAAQQAAARNQITNEVGKYKALILAKIRSRIVMPPDLPGNPAVEFHVTLLPGGDILEVRLTRSSGHAVFDTAVERAIHLSKPLPLPPDPALFNEFRHLNIKVHYRE